MYKELALNTYNRIFPGGLHFLSGSLEVIMDLILTNHSLLTSKVEQHLYIEELKSLFENDKLALIEEQRIKWGQILVADHEKITSLYRRICEFNSEVAKTNQSLRWSGDDEQLSKMYNFLLPKFIDKNTTLYQFKNLFSDKIMLPKQPIQWIQTNRLLGYLFELLLKEGLITNSRYPSVIETSKLFSNSNGKLITGHDLSSAKNALASMDKLPKSADLFIDMLSIIKR